MTAELLLQLCDFLNYIEDECWYACEVCNCHEPGTHHPGTHCDLLRKAHDRAIAELGGCAHMDGRGRRCGLERRSAIHGDGSEGPTMKHCFVPPGSRDCAGCAGKGWVGGARCNACDGRGAVLEES